jgi:hypothetical protein
VPCLCSLNLWRALLLNVSGGGLHDSRGVPSYGATSLWSPHMPVVRVVGVDGSEIRELGASHALLSVASVITGARAPTAAGGSGRYRVPRRALGRSVLRRGSVAGNP